MPLGEKRFGTTGLFAELVVRDWTLHRVAKAFAPEVIVACNSPCGAHVGRVLRRPSVVFEDTEVNRRAHLLYYPFVTEVHSPRAYRSSFGAKHHFYAGYHALSHLHPNRFSADGGVARRLGLPDRFVFVRFVAWGADHDRGAARMSPAERVALVRGLEALGRVVVSSEGELPAAIAHLALARADFSPLDVHHLLASASLVVGESATMSTEAAVLGTPSVYIDAEGRGFTDDIERRYGLCTRIGPHDVRGVLDLARRVLGADREIHRRARDALLADSVDVGTYQLDVIERLARERAVIPARARARS